MRDETLRRTAHALGAVAAVAWLVGTGVIAAGVSHPYPASAWVPRGAVWIASLTFVVGWVVAARRPRNPIGWDFLVSALLLNLSNTGLGIAVLVHADGGATWHAWGAWGSWVTEWAWVPSMVLVLHALARFPGDARTAVDRWADALALLGILAVGGLEAVAAGTFDNVDWFTNPVTLVDAGTAATLAPVFFLPMTALGGIALVRGTTRFRAATGVARQQYRWVLWSAVPLLLSLVTAPLATDERLRDAIAVLNNIGSVLIMVGIAVAVLRHRLYDLDRLVSRTVAWTLLTAAVVALWAAVALLPSALAGGLDTEPEPVLVAAATVVAASVFNPLRTRLQDVVDRRLHRQRYDAQRTVESLGARLSDEVDTGAVRTHVVTALRRTLAPRVVAVWIPHEEHPR